MNAEVDVSAADSGRIMGRAIAYAWPYRYQMLVKILLQFIGLMAILILPWPVKILIDHVILGIAIADSPTPYPPFIAPFIPYLEGMEPIEIAVTIALVSFGLIVAMGAFGARGTERDITQANLSQGEDTATRSENQANVSGSLVSGLLGLFEFHFQLRITHRMNHAIRSRLFDRFMRQPLTNFADRSIGDAVYRVMYDTPAITRLCYDLWLVPTVSTANIVLIVWVMQTSFKAVEVVVWAAAAITPVLFLGTLMMTKAMRRRSGFSRLAGAETTATMEESINNILAVQSLGGSAREQARFEGASAESYARFRSAAVLVIASLLFGYGVALAMMVFVFLIVAEAIINGVFTPGDFVVIITYYLQISTSAFVIGRLWFAVQDNIAGLVRVFSAMDEPSEAIGSGGADLDGLREGIRFENVSYRYPDGTRAVVDVSMEGHVGEMIALAGPTGAGKTSLAYLVPRFLVPDEGRVLYDGTDGAEIQLEALRRQVAFVFQEPSVFDDSVEGNIRMGKPDATPDEIRAAAAMAGANDFIEALPEGYQTSLGRSGAKLSVGQKQRIAIARGLASQRPILILDEPTSALDPETENILVDSLLRARSVRLVIVIAHRLSTIRASDRIYFMQEGRLIEHGSHDALMSRDGGAYRRFVELQSA
ncbi:MAG: ABC transporter ATP-binding protein [Gammaproteobacteria bacterium]|nr:ABC transporter ATP-binding protein [Gammaproteobacteria bacterium]